MTRANAREALAEREAWMAGEALDLATLEAAASSVPDPELPVVTIGDLGIVRGVTVTDDGAVEVRLTPTFVGCPATEAIAADVRAAVAARLRDGGVAGSAPDVEVRTRMVMSPPWSTDWISDDGRRKLAEHGIAPPRAVSRGGGGPVAVTIGRRVGGASAEALGGAGSSVRGGAASGGVELASAPEFSQSSPFPSPNPPTQQNQTQACPHCGSADTRELSAFGSTPCQSLRACRACGEPFGAMKSL